MLDTISSDSYTVIYTTSFKATSTSPSAKEPQQYEMDNTFASPIHMELKRAFDIGKRESNANITLPDGGLFERYQYFGPGKLESLNYSGVLLAHATSRDFHRSCCIFHTSLNSICWHQWHRGSTGLVRCVRQRDGSCRTKEAATVRGIR